MSVDAKAIYEDLLERTRAALVANDPAAWRAQLTTPFLITTTDGRLLLRTEEHFQDNLRLFRRGLQAMGIVRTQRQFIAARLIAPSTIAGYHTIQHFDENGIARPGMEAKWTLQQGQDGQWRVAKNEVAASTREFTLMQLGSFGEVTVRDTDPRSELHKIAQTVVESMDTMGASGDFQGWMHVAMLPLHIVSQNGSKVLKTPQEMHKEFLSNQKELAQKHLTDSVRMVKNVQEQNDGTLLVDIRVHLLSNGTYITPPWDGQIHLRKANGFWRVFRIIRPHGHAAVLPEGS
jgi:hypothetical protein